MPNIDVVIWQFFQEDSKKGIKLSIFEICDYFYIRNRIFLAKSLCEVSDYDIWQIWTSWKIWTSTHVISRIVKTGIWRLILYNISSIMIRWTYRQSFISAYQDNLGCSSLKFFSNFFQISSTSVFLFVSWTVLELLFFWK